MNLQSGFTCREVEALAGLYSGQIISYSGNKPGWSGGLCNPCSAHCNKLSNQDHHKRREDNTTHHSASSVPYHGSIRIHRLPVPGTNDPICFRGYCTVPTNSSVTRHSSFFLTPDLIFSRFMAILGSCRKN